MAKIKQLKDSGGESYYPLTSYNAVRNDSGENLGTRLSGIESEVAANTSARHTHDNKETLDAITADYKSSLDVIIADYADAKAALTTLGSKI